MSWGVQSLVLVPVLYDDGRMVDTWTPQGSSSCLRVSVTRFRAALDAPYAARQGNGWSPKSTGKASAWPLSCSKIKARYPTKELVIFFFVCSAAVQLPSPTEPDQMSPKVLSFLSVFLIFTWTNLCRLIFQSIHPLVHNTYTYSGTKFRNPPRLFSEQRS